MKPSNVPRYFSLSTRDEILIQFFAPNRLFSYSKMCTLATSLKKTHLPSSIVFITDYLPCVFVNLRHHNLLMRAVIPVERERLTQ